MTSIASIYVPASLGVLSSRTATTCARRTDGALLCWGNNQNLGTGRHNVTGGAGFFCDRRPLDNSLWCWGNNEFGQLGDSTTLQRTTPVQVEALASDVSSASAGGNHTCALKTDGTLWCWGQNRSGQLGLGDTRNRSTPTEVTALGSGVVAVFGGAEHTCAVKMEESGQSLYCWGLNGQGQLGLGDTHNRTTPERIDFDDLGTGVSVVSLGAAHTCAAKSDGSLYCWGENRFGQLGLNKDDRERVLTPAPVFAGVMSSGVAVVYAGGSHTCARSNDNALWCWGQNQNQQLGRMTNGDALQPFRVSAPCN